MTKAGLPELPPWEMGELGHAAIAPGNRSAP